MLVTCKSVAGPTLEYLFTSLNFPVIEPPTFVKGQVKSTGRSVASENAGE